MSIAAPFVTTHGATATALADGRIFLAGVDRTGGTRVCDPAKNQWSATVKMNVARRDRAAALLPSGKVLLSGGNLPDGLATQETELFDPTTFSYEKTGLMLAENGP